MSKNLLELYCLIFPNKKRYFGISFSAEKRFMQHKKNAESGMNTLLYKAMRKYCSGGISLRILVVGPEKYIQDLEISAIRQFETSNIKYGYNVHPGGTLSPASNPLVAQKISRKLKGRKPSNSTIAASRKSRLGVPLTSEHKAAIADGLRGKSPSLEHRQALSSSQKEKPKTWSEGGRKKFLEVHMGNKYRRGAILSEETKQKIRVARAKQVITPAMIEALKTGDPRVGGLVATHNRWHVVRGIVNPNCSLCRGDG